MYATVLSFFVVHIVHEDLYQDCEINTKQNRTQN